jgi:hypothetical protein
LYRYAAAPHVKLHVEVTERGYAIEARNLRAVSPTAVPLSEALTYVPCQIDPAAVGLYTSNPVRPKACISA